MVRLCRIRTTSGTGNRNWWASGSSTWAMSASLRRTTVGPTSVRGVPNALEHPEEGALGDTGRAGKLLGGGRHPLVQHDRDHRVEDRGAALLWRQGTGAGWHTEHCK